MGTALRTLPACPCLGARGPRDKSDEAGDPSKTQLSKAEEKRLKKLERKQQQQGQFAIHKREKKKAQRGRKRDARRELLAAMTEEERNSFVQTDKARLQVQKEEEQASLEYAFQLGGPKVVVNCSFADSMDLKELTSLAKQLLLSYTVVRDVRSPMQLHFTSLHQDNPGLYALEKIGFKKWLVHVHQKSVWELFDLDRLVVLSPDAEEDLDEVCLDKVYVIGGLVDRTIKRNQTKAQAEASGSPILRKLPIKSMGPPGMFPVLNIDVVVRILHERLTRGPSSSWSEILLDCMPQRQQPGPSRQELRKERARQRKAGIGDEEVLVDEAGTRPKVGDEVRIAKDGICKGALGEVVEDDGSAKPFKVQFLTGQEKGQARWYCEAEVLFERTGEANAVCDDQSDVQEESDTSDSDADAEDVQLPDLRQGTEIEVAGFGLARIISLGRLPHGKHQGKYKIRYNDDGSLYHLLPEQIARVIPP